MVDFNESRFLMLTFGGSFDVVGSPEAPCPLVGNLFNAAAPASCAGVALDASAPHRTVPVPVWAKEDGAVVVVTPVCETAVGDDTALGGGIPLPLATPTTGGTLPMFVEPPTLTG